MKTKVVAVIAGTLTLMVGGLAAADQVSKTTDANVGIYPELMDEPIDYERLLADLSASASSLEGEIERGEISIPDYKPARKVLKQSIIISVANYLNALERIKKEIAPFYSRLAALQEEIKKNSASRPLFSKLLRTELTRNAPALNSRINEIYGDALENLDSLTNQFEIFPANSAFANRYYYPAASDFQSGHMQQRNPVIAACRTAACVYMIGEDLAAWVSVVKGLNRDIDFRNVKKETFFDFESGSSSPLLSDTMLDFAKDLLQGPKTNQRYTVAGYVAEVLKQPAGAAVGLAAAPLYVFEKTFEFSKNVLDSSIIKIELKLNRKKNLRNATKKPKVLSMMLETQAARLPSVELNLPTSSAPIP